MITREDGKQFRSPEDMRRYQLLERVGQLLYGDRWQNRLRQDMGMGASHFPMITAGERSITDDLLNRAIQSMIDKRADLVRQIRKLVLEEARIRTHLGSACTVETMGPGEQMREIEELELKP